MNPSEMMCPTGSEAWFGMTSGILHAPTITSLTNKFCLNDERLCMTTLEDFCVQRSLMIFVLWKNHGSTGCNGQFLQMLLQASSVDICCCSTSHMVVVPASSEGSPGCCQADHVWILAGDQALA